jgi:hypothetical protein
LAKSYTEEEQKRKRKIKCNPSPALPCAPKEVPLGCYAREGAKSIS